MRVGVVVLLLSSVVIPLTAATRTWTGTTDGNWMTATNWGGTAPVAGDDLVFPAAGANQATTNNFPALTLFNSLTFSGGAYTLNGNAITLGAGGIVTTGGTTHSILLPITLGASQTWILGTGTTVTNLAATNLNGMALTIENTGNAPSDWAGPISGTGSITLNNSNRGVSLSGANTTFAPFIVNDSFFAVNAGTYPGSITGNGAAVFINAGATVGAVTVNGPFGLFAAGNPTVNVAGNTGSLAVNDFVLYLEQINNATDFNWASVTGTVTLGKTFMLLNNNSAVPPGTTFTIINNDGSDAVAGRFIGLPQGGNITSQGMQPQNFTISYTGGTGNDVVLTAQAVVTTTTTTTLTSSVNPSAFEQSVTFTATVTPDTGTATPTGTVTFLDVTSVVPNELATVPLNSSGVATLTISSLPPGTNGIVAQYNGGGVFGGSAGEVEQVVTAPVPALDGRALALLALVFAAIGFVFLRAK